MTKKISILNNGFTLIELLVVIAIIGVLASVVLSSVSSARTRAADSAIRSNLSGIRTQGALYYDTNGNYGSNTYCTASGQTLSGCVGLFSSTQAGKNLVAASTAANNSTLYAHTNVAGDAWGVGAVLTRTNTYSATSGTDYFCVDSSGSAKVVDTMTITANFTVCP